MMITERLITFYFVNNGCSYQFLTSAKSKRFIFFKIFGNAAFLVTFATQCVINELLQKISCQDEQCLSVGEQD